MKKITELLFKDAWFYVFSITSIAFLLAGFLVPPLGIISPTVLTGVGEIFAWGILGTVLKAIDKGTPAKIEKGDIKLTVGDDKEEN